MMSDVLRAPWDVAMDYHGWPYFLGAGLAGYPSSPPYIDCGLLTQRVISKSFGVSVARTVTEQVQAAPYVQDVQGWSESKLLQSLRPGVFLAFDWHPETARFSHTGVINPDIKLIHASTSRGVVVDPVGYLGGGWRSIYAFDGPIS